ncbi:MAG: DUF4292 domain-containing protein [Bacteroidia bacterium]|nr:DUF4292 domain-containing protein [Bacteroidia bacterium]NNM22370.1 DUF4292 domain-containing protein [Flavobacteriaceae bacterium]
MRYTSIILILFITFFAACKGPKAVVGSNTANPGLAIKSIISAHKAATPKFNTLSSRIKVAYEDEKQRQSITVSLRMERDQKIWVKASILGITLAKAMITRDRVSYYETLSNTYFDGDFTLLSRWLGTDLDFEKAQAILLGQSIFGLENGKYKATVSENRYKLEPSRQPHNFVHSLLLNPGNFKVDYGRVLQPNENRELTIAYGDYQELQGSYYPSAIEINSLEGNSRTHIAVNYRKIDLNVSVNFPFQIPEGYKEIDLSE